MGGSKSQTWIAGTVLVALLIVAGAWFLLVSPRRAQTDEARDANEAALSEQDVLRARLAVLQEQSTHLEEYQAEVDALSVQIPSEPRLPDYVRSLQGLADQYGVVITALSPSYPLAFSEAADTAAVVTPTEPEATDPVDTAEDTAAEAEETSDAAAEEPVVEPTPTPETTAATGLFAIPVGMQVVGTYSNVIAFLEGVQTQVGRLFLVTSLDALSQDAQESQGGRPATAPGDLELTINGFLYEYLDATPAVTDTSEPTEEPAEPAPLPTSERNPFASVTGS